MKKLNTQDNLEILRKIDTNPKASQRDLAEKLGFSIGKINYCLKGLQNKGLIKIENLQKKENKINYLKEYVLTKQGVLLRTKLTIDFMKRKLKEYDELKKDLSNES